MKNLKVDPTSLTVNSSSIRKERNNYFGQALKEIRQEKKLTQEEVSEKVGMSQKMWSSYEIGKSRPNLDTIIVIARGLEIDPLDVVRRSLSKRYHT